MTVKGTGRQGCIVDGCDRKHSSKGYCNLHYQRIIHHGDPLAGGPVRETPRGMPMQWLIAHAEYDGDDCLKWPYADDGYGYGNVAGYGKAHRIMCELVNGPPPFQKAEAAHSCGRGHLGCVNPKHLSWATPAENQWDRLDHGTTNRGEASGTHKLVEGEVLEIVSLLEVGGTTHQALADAYGVHRCTITDIAKGKNWSWLTGRVFSGNPTDPRRPANDNAELVRAAA